MKSAIIYLAAITVAEVITNFTDALIGILLHTLVLVSLIIHSSVTSDSPNHRLLLSLTLTPLTRIVSLAMPLTMFPVIYWYMVIYPTLLAATFVMIRHAKYSLVQIGVNRKALFDQGAIALTGFSLGLFEYAILRPSQAIVPELTIAWGLFGFAVLLLGTGFVEEIIFRGVAQTASIEVLGKWGIPYMAYIFAILHLIHHSPFDIFFVMAVGILFGWFVKKTGSIVGVTIAHGITNFMLYVLMPSIW